LALLEANIQRLESLKNETEQFNKQGFVENIDVQRLQVTYNNLLTEQQKVNQLMQLADALLKFQMGFDVTQPIQLTDTLNNADLSKTQIDATNFKFENRVEYQLLSKQKQLNQLNLKRYQLGTLPNLIAIGNYTTQHSNDKFIWYNHLGDFYNSALIGVQLNFTIFDGLQNKYRKNYTRLQIQQNENDLFNLKNALALDMLSSDITLKNSMLSVKAQKENMDLADEVVRVTKIKYQQGVGSNLEVLNAETSLKEAQTNYFSALYDAYIAKVNFEKATGTLIGH
jgi:outer membrane protein